MFNTGMFQYDNQFVVMARAAAQQFTGLGDAVIGHRGARAPTRTRRRTVGERLEETARLPVPRPDWQMPEREPLQRAASWRSSRWG